MMARGFGILLVGFLLGGGIWVHQAAVIVSARWRPYLSVELRLSVESDVPLGLGTAATATSDEDGC